MAKKDPRVDSYIAKSADFAKPILVHLRKLVHEGCPDVEETIKWGLPAFEYNGFLGGMAAFKAHCAFNLWKGPLLGAKNEDAMGQFGRITSVSDLPKDSVLIGYVREAARLNAEGVKVPRSPKPPKKLLATPPDLASALKKNTKARATFEAFSPSHKREYVEWITEARTEETRKKRLGTAIEWMAEGKPRMWKYMAKR
ncbi:MAG TPA: YdeI/OmpD-associated family protein [Thermoanaerobaculia bacterium]|nr:YdeI/OmpD-associated family protein [Thermoanaerobaculia bacterium]